MFVFFFSLYSLLTTIANALLPSLSSFIATTTTTGAFLFCCLFIITNNCKSLVFLFFKQKAPLIYPLFICNSCYCSSFLFFVHSHHQLLVFLFFKQKAPLLYLVFICNSCCYYFFLNKKLLFSIICSFVATITIPFFCRLYIFNNSWCCSFFLSFVHLQLLLLLSSILCSFSPIIVATPFLFHFVKITNMCYSLFLFLFVHIQLLLFSLYSFLTMLLLFLTLVHLQSNPLLVFVITFYFIEHQTPRTHLFNFNHVFKVVVRMLHSSLDLLLGLFLCGCCWTKIHTPISKRVSLHTHFEIVKKSISYLFNYWWWQS